MSDNRPQFSGSAAQAVKAADPFDLVLIGLAVLSLIFSFFDFYKYSVGTDQVSVSGTVSAWHGFLGWFGVVLMLLGAAVIVLKAMTGAPAASAGLLAGLFGAALVCMLLALFIIPGDTLPNGVGVHLDKGHGFAYWLVLLFSLIAAAIAGFRFRTSLLH